MAKSRRDWYSELSSRLDAVSISGNTNELHAICNKIAWCFKWKLITHTQMEELCATATEYWAWLS